MMFTIPRFASKECRVVVAHHSFEIFISHLHEFIQHLSETLLYKCSNDNNWKV